MTYYLYEAMDNTGLMLKDQIEAESEASAIQKIREKGFFVTNIERVKVTFPELKFDPPKTPSKPSPTTIVLMGFGVGFIFGAMVVGLVFTLVRQ